MPLDPPPAGAPAQQRTSGLAIAALVLALIGFCLPPLWLVSIGLGIAALVKIKDDPALGGSGLAIAGIAIPVVGVMVVGVLAAIAIPNFIRFQARSKQSECKVNLKSMYTAEMAHFAEHQSYDAHVSKVGFDPERGNRYAYFLSADGPLQDRSAALAAEDPEATGVGVDTFKYGAKHQQVTAADLPADLAGGVRVGARGTCPDCSFTAACAGNVDEDATLDVWSISTEERTGPGGELIQAGQPFNDVNDVTD